VTLRRPVHRALLFIQRDELRKEKLRHLNVFAREDERGIKGVYSAS
jgi:hypothetical protein